jgi:hypothetical protein
MNILRRSMIGMILVTTCFAALNTIGQNVNQTAIIQETDEAAVKAAVESFLSALGNGELEKVKAMLLPNANIASIHISDGKSKIFTIPADQFISQREGGRKFKEPVMQFAVNISQGMLAFVRADATVYYGDVADHQTNDFFILMKDNGVWKILSGSYTNQPLTKED